MTAFNIFNEETIGPVLNIVAETVRYDSDHPAHPERNLLQHSLQTYLWALREAGNNTDLILAALLHDVGKLEDPLGHDKIGADMVKPYTSVKTHWLIQNHMRFWHWIEGDMKKLKKVTEIHEHPWLNDLAALGRWDKMARRSNTKLVLDRQAVMDTLNQRVADHFAENKRRAAASHDHSTGNI